jgi:FkbM family methyltransferase
MENSSSHFQQIRNLMRKFLRYLKKLGFLKGIILLIQIRLFPKKGLIYVSIPELSNPIIVRGKTTDVYIFEKIFILEDYNIPYFINFDPRLIIDGGAYVGYSSIFFANKFPDSLVVAVEPENSNFSILEKNTSKYLNIRREQAGIWNKNTFLKIKDIGVGHYGFIVEEANKKDNRSLKAITISDILEKYNFNKIDILKLDTEGAEKAIFSSNFDDWLSKTKMIIIELHDFNWEGCTETVHSAINKYNFTEILRDEENIYFLRKDQ